MTSDTAMKTEDIELQLFLEAVYQRYHYDFRGYSKASIKRRLLLARERIGCTTFSGLQDRMLHDHAVLPQLLDYLTVQVSDMFRDPGYFRALREQILPHLKAIQLLLLRTATEGREVPTGEYLFLRDDCATVRHALVQLAQLLSRS